ncbi:hypothetical protein [Arthrobacter sp. 49Tsu3.1M3]|uniref:hypothetical protein n=1 Tax=Arthrobacter sp. 49Tsu3.1M3 TaxID=1279029 RepID=UPI002118AA85|nr:hypothetical protein [Arthrobacter sp. 49Tsu3.1M3]
MNVIQPDDDGGRPEAVGVAAAVLPGAVPEAVSVADADGVVPCVPCEESPDWVFPGWVVPAGGPADVASGAAPDVAGGAAGDPQPASSRAASTSAEKNGAGAGTATTVSRRLAMSPGPPYCPAGRSEVIIFLMSWYSEVSR